MLTFTFHVLIVIIVIIVMLTFTCFFSLCLSFLLFAILSRLVHLSPSTFSPNAVRCSLVTVRCSLFAVHHSPFAVDNLPFTVRQFRSAAHSHSHFSYLVLCSISIIPPFYLIFQPSLFSIFSWSFSRSLSLFGRLRHFFSLSLSFLPFLFSFSFSLLFDLTLFDWLPRHGGAGGLRVSS